MPALSNPASFATRPATEADHEFLYRTFVSGRESEFDLLRLDPASKAALLRQQFEAQHAYYHEHYSAADYLVIERGRLPAGRIYVDYSSDPIILIEITLLPQHRNAGIGTTLLEDLTRCADSSGRTIGLHVEPHNPARRLYERFGFVPAGNGGVYLQMKRSPKSQ